MTKVGDALKNSLQKRAKALSSFEAKREAYLQTRKEILKDIEEARAIWIETLSKLPNPDFNQ